MDPCKHLFPYIRGASICLMLVSLCVVLSGCASTPEQKEAANQRKLAKEQSEADTRQKFWQQKLAAFSDEQLRFKFAALEQEIASGRQQISIMLALGNQMGVYTTQIALNRKVRERDGIGMELIRRGSTFGSAQPDAHHDSGGNSPPKGGGTGFFISEDGCLVTCQHVVANASKIFVRTKSGMLNARMLREDRENDIAILKVDGNFAALPLVSSGLVKLGQSVFTIGFPNPDVQGVEPKLTRGDISSLAGIQDDPRYFQTTVAVQPGNSGGPLINQSGNVVGVLVARLSDIKTLKRTGSLPQNVNYAIKSSLLNMVLESLPDVAGKLKEARPDKDRKPEEVASEAQPAVAIVVVY